MRHGTFYFLRNLQDDVIGLLDSTGTIVVNYVYDSWGKLISTTGSAASTIGALNPIRYRGYYYDTETGLYYCQSRYYSPEWGRWLNADDIGEIGSNNNLFSYCNNNPINYRDETGKSITLTVLGTAAVIATVVMVVSLLLFYFGTTMSPKFQHAVGPLIWRAIDDTVARLKPKFSMVKGVAALIAAAAVAKMYGSKTRYWGASIKKNHITLGKPLSYQQAVNEVASGGNVLCITSGEAYNVARAAGKNNPIGPENHGNGRPGYYPHYHTFGHGRGHVWFLLP